MSTIIRLQGLPAIADSVDIRQFFCGLNIPKGGVYITGGTYGEAFIIFATCEDARCALCLSGRPLKNSHVHLTPSSESEMQRALEIYRQGLKDSMGGLFNPGTNVNGPSYIYVHGMPMRATKVEIRAFFKGLTVVDVVFLKFFNGIRNGNGIVKFEKGTDASDGLKFNNQSICGSPVALKLSDEKEWIKNGGKLSGRRRERSSSRTSSNRRRRTRSRSRSRSRYRSRSRSRYRSRSRSRSRSSSPNYNRRDRRRSPYIREFYVHLINLSYRVDKKDIKRLFYDLDLSDSQITFLLDKDGRRTREAFTMFTTQKDYRRALSLNEETFKGNTINILPISKKGMLEMIERMKTRISKDHPDIQKSASRSSQEKKCIYLRNFASDVTKANVQNFFTGFSVKDADVSLLFDDKGVGLGEALVKFADEKEAYKAEKLNHQKFLGTEILLSRISEEQMKALNNGTSVSHHATKYCDEMSLVTQADDMPDESLETVSKPGCSLIGSSLDSSGVMPALDSKEVGIHSDSDGKVPSLISKREYTALDSIKAMGETTSLDCIQTIPFLGSASPLKQNDPVDENPVESKLSLYGENGSNEVPTLKTNLSKKNGVTLVFVRNLPFTVTVAEILDFFHGYKIRSVNLKNIERGIATVRMPTYQEAMSAINALNKKEIGLKQVSLSLI
ncbi:RNA-binding protein 12B-like [Mixophyes fleayi]|uniref:RNA-binding protein 12B-like n=1 Tax=Mixophyes fleayi TaxID=3061075 RepID=UPI003F4E1E76